ncbi:DUF58 domain-containing protein [Pikeienuella piscinae]|uniref:DUF58 domain-containing protein n=1 Tax=Pikeienuella piscinae TaxID=2748098 RepID=A0A7L5C1G2_9RHOB|nr:DUF58 domain-containing protein [Pikeienuella piscinae]QIE55984.1 DUF58 domain-containing protein [Pikeienuella piscinae]
MAPAPRPRHASAQPPPVERVGAGWLRRDAERIAGALPPLLAEAERLAASVTAGVHGRRRAGPGETFWQFRAAQPGDPHQAVDWRRSARSEQMFVREMEWEAAQTVSIWSDDALAMDFRSDRATRTKAERAALLAMALGVLLIRGGERVGLLGGDAARPASGETQLMRMGAVLTGARAERPDFGVPPRAEYARGGRAVFLSDFMGPREEIFPSLVRAAEAGVSGAYVQIVDRAEETFPFDGRLIFESMGRDVKFETDRARGLQAAYRERLAERRRDLERMARRCGWRCLIHRTDESPRKALLWLYATLAGGRR